MSKSGRHTCIFCGTKREQYKMSQIRFRYYKSPAAMAVSYHWVCKDGCVDKLVKTRFETSATVIEENNV